ncbi:MAG: cyclodeaminase/cyclohydrolase family protein [Caldilineaceae bacterium]
MTSTATMAIGAFLDQLAAKQSTPGGGGAAALTGSQAAALVSMVLNFTVGVKKYADVEEEMQGYLRQSEALRQQLLQLADEDVEAFAAVSACYGMPRATDAEKAARTAALQNALKGAAQTPFKTAQASLEVMKLAGPVGAKGNVNIASDAATALYLANAALKSAIVNVNINLKFIKDDAFVAEWSARRDALLATADALYAQSKTACETALELPL